MNRSLVIAIALSIVAIGWVLSGSHKSTKEEAPSIVGSEVVPDKFRVKVKTIVAETMPDNLYLQGQIEAAREIEIKAEVQGVITRLGSKKGSRLKQGDHILELDLSDRLARLKKAKAELEVKKSERKAGAKLQEKNLLSKNQHQQNIANVLAGEAEVKEIEVEISKTRVKAPFASVLNDVHVEMGDFVSIGDALVFLVDDSHVLISAEVPQQYIAKIALGQRVEATLLDDRKLEGSISFISTSANPNTKTFRIEAKAKNVKNIMRFGQSARVSILLGEQKAHKLTASLLDLDSEGVLQVKGVDGKNRVVTHSVDIIRSERDGLWLKGLPDEFRVITIGQGFVSQGDEVVAVDEQEKAAETL